MRVVPLADTMETSRPDASKLVSGDPVHRTWNLTEDRGLYCGIWESTPGAWRIKYDEWEYCRILSGTSRITDNSGHTWEVTAGDSFTLPAGFEGVWEVIETTRKDYVILLRD
ncbi:cupin domain-containing protein [Albirhodobacter sp. R86504]|uniref:cupin domain-containing protein n=1 Tax=Albirhodobacter sp. R86504 TaxID=3093848 RepID=UPI0036706325